MMTHSHNVCPICGEGHLEPCIGKNAVEYKGKSVELDTQYSVCDVCGSEQADAVQLRTNKRAMTAFRKQVNGLLSGAEVRNLRERLRISQAEAANIFGGGPVAFSKYESDDVAQSEPMDKLLRLSVTEPIVFTRLTYEAGIRTDVDGAWIKVEHLRLNKRQSFRVISETKSKSKQVWGKTG